MFVWIGAVLSGIVSKSTDVTDVTDKADTITDAFRKRFGKQFFKDKK